MRNPGFLNWFKNAVVELGRHSLCKSNDRICYDFSTCWEDYKCLYTLCEHQIQVLPNMRNKQSKAANQMPESDWLMEFKLGYGFHFKPKGTLKARRRKKGKKKQEIMFLIVMFSYSQIQSTYFQMYFSNFFYNIFLAKWWVFYQLFWGQRYLHRDDMITLIYKTFSHPSLTLLVFS